MVGVGPANSSAHYPAIAYDRGVKKFVMLVLMLAVFGFAAKKLIDNA
jgi:hypothetical protein